MYSMSKIDDSLAVIPLELNKLELMMNKDVYVVILTQQLPNL